MYVPSWSHILPGFSFVVTCTWLVLSVRLQTQLYLYTRQVLLPERRSSLAGAQKCRRAARSHGARELPEGAAAHQVLRRGKQVVKLVLVALEFKLDAVKAGEDGVAHACAATCPISARRAKGACAHQQKRWAASPDVPSWLTPLWVSTRLTISFCTEPLESMAKVLAGLTRCGAVLASAPLLVVEAAVLAAVLTPPGLRDTVAAVGLVDAPARFRLVSALAAGSVSDAGSTAADLETATALVVLAGSVVVSRYCDTCDAGCPLAGLAAAPLESAAQAPPAARARRVPSSTPLSCLIRLEYATQARTCLRLESIAFQPYQIPHMYNSLCQAENTLLFTTTLLSIR